MSEFGLVVPPKLHVTAYDFAKLYKLGVGVAFWDSAVMSLIHVLPSYAVSGLLPFTAPVPRRSVSVCQVTAGAHCSQWTAHGHWSLDWAARDRWTLQWVMCRRAVCGFRATACTRAGSH